MKSNIKSGNYWELVAEKKRKAKETLELAKKQNKPVKFLIKKII